MFLIDLGSVENLLNVMDLQKVNVTRENVMHPAKKESMTYLPNSLTYLLNNERRHIRQGKLHVACITMKSMKPIKNHILY